MFSTFVTIMLWYCVMLIGIVLANPISNKLDVDVQSISDDTANDVSITHDSEKSLDVHCSADTFVDELVENSSSIADDSNLWRRKIEYCPSGSTTAKQPQPLRRPPSTESSEPSDKLCPDKSGKNRVLRVTCAGPEVWRSKPDGLVWVGNCEAGHDSEFSSGPIIPGIGVDRTARYCCKSYNNRPKYYAGLSCDKLDDVQMPEWTLQQLSNIHDVY